MSDEEAIAAAQAAPNDDVSLLPRQLRMLAEQMRTSFELLGVAVRNGFARIEKRLDAHSDSIAEHGRDLVDHRKDIADLKKRVSTLEARAKTPKKKRT